jgi:hypothetical protein
LAFVTGLTFVGGGSFTGTMTPITAQVAAVPEPAAFGLLGSALAGLGFFAFWRHRPPPTSPHPRPLPATEAVRELPR